MQKLKNLLQEDFDKAVAQPYHSRECLIAQAMIRQGVTPMGPFHPVGLAEATGLEFDKARATFDKHFNVPGDENKPELQALRASLPIS